MLALCVEALVRVGGVVDDLQLARLGDVVPLLLGRHAGHEAAVRGRRVLAWSFVGEGPDASRPTWTRSEL